MRKIAIIVFLILISISAQAASIRFGINASNSRPLLYQVSNPDLATGGFIYEISVAIADELDHNYTIVTLPRAEIASELINGTVDAACHISVNWKQNLKNKVEWSRPLYTYSNVLVAKKTIPYNHIGLLRDARIGTVVNYVYIDLEEKIKEKKVIRHDSLSVAASLKKLFENKIDYLVMSNIEYNFYKKKHPELHRSSFEMDVVDIRCALSKKSRVSINKLNQVLERLKNKQVFQKIYDRYLDPKTTPVPISYGIYDSNSPPFFFSDNSTRPPKVTGGIFYDLALAVGKKLNRPLNFILLPRNRLGLSLATGHVELVCYNSEEWAKDYGKDYYWSIPIFKQSDYIVSHRIITKDIKMNSIEDLKGKTVGTMLGFVYPTMTKHFKDGSIIREDVTSGAANIAKLNANRVSFILMNNLQYIYYKKRFPDLTRAPFEIDPVNIKCAVSKKSHLKIEDVNSALKELMKTDQLQRIFNTSD